MKKRRVSKKSGQSAKRKTGFDDRAVLFTFLVLLIIVVFYFSTSTPQEDIRKEQELLLSKLVIDHPSQNGPAIIVGNSVDDSMLSRISAMDYPELKKMLGVDNEFVIYFEDEDGNLIQLAEKPCIGSSYATLNGRSCG